MKRIGVLWLIMASFVSCSDTGRTLFTVNVMSATKDMVTIEVRNNSDEELVLLSPETPAREVDEAACHVKLSTRIDDRIRPFVFTPQLIAVRGGGEMQFRAVLHPLVIPEPCRDVLVSVEYAFVRPAEVELLRHKTSEDFRQYVLKNQRLVATNRRVTIGAIDPTRDSREP